MKGARIGLGAMLFLAIAGASEARNLTVTVSGQQGAVAGVTVCIGTAADRAFYGRRTTGPSGSAVFSGLPDQTQVLITARAGNRGGERAMSTSLGQAMVSLPAAPGGPDCPQTAGGGATQSGTTQGGQPITIDRKAIKDKFAEVGGQQPTRPRDPLAHPPEPCFGAAGSQCGFQQGLGNAGFCVGTTCPVNGGSWEHDECCWQMWPSAAKGCVSGPLDNLTQLPGNACSAAWDKAIARTFGGWSWLRTVNPQVLNTTGQVNFAQYCALAGSVVHMGDVQYCCSGSARGVLDADLDLLGSRIALRSTARICN